MTIRRASSVRVVLVALCLYTSNPHAQAVRAAIVIRAARVLDVKDGTVLEGQSIVIQDGRIASIGPSARVTGPADARHIDLPRATVLPGLIDVHTHLTREIVQAPGVVAIRYELIHETRVIPLDPRPHVGRAIHLDMGDARAHWERDTLVVETHNFNDRSTYRNAAAATLRLVERFTRTSPGRLEWAVTVDDPETWTRPWTFVVPLTSNEHERVLEFACHEGNYALPHMLEAARADERKDAAVRVVHA